MLQVVVRGPTSRQSAPRFRREFSAAQGRRNHAPPGRAWISPCRNFTAKHVQNRPGRGPLVSEFLAADSVVVPLTTFGCSCHLGEPV